MPQFRKTDGGLTKSAPAAARRDRPCGEHLALSDLEPAHSGWSYWSILAALRVGFGGTSPAHDRRTTRCGDRNRQSARGAPFTGDATTRDRTLVRPTPCTRSSCGTSNYTSVGAFRMRAPIGRSSIAKAQTEEKHLPLSVRANRVAARPHAARLADLIRRTANGDT